MIERKPLKLSVVVLTFSLLLIQFIAKSQTLTISGTNAVNSIVKDVQTVVDANITIASNQDDIANFTVSISDSYQNGDVLSYTGTLPSGVFTSGFNTTSRSITFSGTASPAVWQGFLRRVTIKTANNNCLSEPRKVTFLAGQALYNPLNGHFYRLTTTQSSWKTAKATTESISYYGRQGYLVTITSAAENSFLQAFVARDSWIGASDEFSQINEAVGYTKYANQAASEGRFYWVTGPEKGTAISIGNSNGITRPTQVAGVYSNWDSTNPDNFNMGGELIEHYAHFKSNGGQWNDYWNTQPIFSIYEFGGMPNDNISDIPFYTREIAVQGASTSRITGGGVSVCPGTNSTVLTLSNFTGTVVRWESSTDNFVTAGTQIANTSTTLTATNLTRTTYYRAVVNSTAPNTCSGLVTPSTVISADMVETGNILATGGTDICVGGNLGLVLSGSNAPVAKWQKSTDNTNWTDISNTTVNYSEVVNATGTFYYRAEVSNSCGPALVSRAITVNVTSGAPPVGGTVSSTSHTSTTNSGTLTLSGHTGTVQKWQKSEDNGFVWIDIVNTSTSNGYANNTKNTLYRARVQNGSCGSTYSAAGQVTILTPAISFTGSLTPFNACSGTASAAQTFTVSGANLTADISLAALAASRT